MYLPEVMSDDDVERHAFQKCWLVMVSKTYIREMLTGDDIEDILYRSADWRWCRRHAFQKCWPVMISKIYHPEVLAGDRFEDIPSRNYDW